MTIKELEHEQAELNKRQSILRKESFEISDRNREISIEIKKLIFEKVIESIGIGEEISFSGNYGDIRNGDILEVIRKNKKSVTIKYLSREYRWGGKVGDVKRMPSDIFGKMVYEHSSKSAMIKRDDRLKEILGDS